MHDSVTLLVPQDVLRIARIVYTRADVLGLAGTESGQPVGRFSTRQADAKCIFERMNPESTKSPHRALELAVASLGGVGFVPRGPATVGTAVGAGAFFLFRPRPSRRIMLAVAATIAGQACAIRLHSDTDPDPQYVIIDELAGVWLALAALPATNRSWVAGSIAFRVLDKLKPGPIGVVDRHSGSWSLMGDDLLAGVFAAILVRLGARLGASSR